MLAAKLSPSSSAGLYQDKIFVINRSVHCRNVVVVVVIRGQKAWKWADGERRRPGCRSARGNGEMVVMLRQEFFFFFCAFWVPFDCSVVPPVPLATQTAKSTPVASRLFLPPTTSLKPRHDVSQNKRRLFLKKKNKKKKKTRRNPPRGSNDAKDGRRCDDCLANNTLTALMQSSSRGASSGTGKSKYSGQERQRICWPSRCRPPT
ncbi:uncharacterized protein IWZ02DRAFT_295282 [Phyllosticta citriasiana]|uniref:uncharacterized protein n=1 Tax=Phyllosticta citriasiana TaxID=595635 RepID=UPI0030FD417D